TFGDNTDNMLTGFPIDGNPAYTHVPQKPPVQNVFDVGCLASERNIYYLQMDDPTKVQYLRLSRTPLTSTAIAGTSPSFPYQNVSNSYNAHVLVIEPAGTVLAWGIGSSGCLGQGNTIQYSYPVRVKGPGGSGYLTDVVAVATGGDTQYSRYRSFAVKSDGTLWAWGSSDSTYPLGTGDTGDVYYPKQVKGPGGTGYLQDIVAVFAGGGGNSAHQYAIDKSGKVYVWGYVSPLHHGGSNSISYPILCYQDNSSTLITGVVAAWVGGRSNVLLKEDGTLWGLGENGGSVLGSSSISTYFQRIHPSHTNVVAISGGTNYGQALDNFSFLKNDGTVWSVGYNNMGQLGDGTTTNRSSPVQLKGPGNSGYITDAIALSRTTHHGA
ncbi:MAG: hypothetical protein EB075_14860, partial [Bacteroidetes bacterium]|nr:hypothetical protein [Bacteroidota bacterium]